MDYTEVVQSMHDYSRLGYSDAAKSMGREPLYIVNLLREGRDPKLDDFAQIVNAFGFRLIVRGEGFAYSIRRTREDAAQSKDDVAAQDALRKMTASHPELGYIFGRHSGGTASSSEHEDIPTLDRFVSIAEMCGNEVYVSSGSKTYYLSYRARLKNPGRISDASKPSVSRANRTASHSNARDEVATRGSSQQVSATRAQELNKMQGKTGAARFTGRTGAEQHVYKQDYVYDARGDRRSTDVDKGAMNSRLQPVEFQHENVVEFGTTARQQTPATNSWQVKAEVQQPIQPEKDPVEHDVRFYGKTVQPNAPAAPRSSNASNRQARPVTSGRPLTREEQKLSDYKKRLLDLSMRNNLLNYRDKKTGTIRVISPDMAGAYRRIVINERPMTFRDSSVTEGAAVASDSSITTERKGGDLIRSLRRLDTVARSSIEEQGINILHLAFGMLRWIDDMDKEHVAPLVMAPVRLSRASARSSFVLQSGDDDPVVNPTLAYFLEQTFDIVLPAFEKEDSLQNYLVSVANIVQTRPGWAVATDVVLSTFQFQKLSMYHDLETRSADIVRHPVVKAIMGDGSALEDAIELENPDLLKPTDTFQVVDADASQQAAILAAHKGESFVLQGPPGTGKSQTITNIIADCLGCGKKVLFVSEKKAALDVVHRRLTQSKLDDFCLVLHSNKAGKKEVLGQLDKTLSLYGTRPRMSSAASTRLNTMVRLRDELNGYADAIYAPLEPLRRSPYDVIGDVSRYEHDGVPWVSCRIDDIRSLTPAGITEKADAVRAYARELERLGGSPESDPWREFGIEELEYGESSEVLGTFSRVATGARTLLDVWRRETSKLGLDVTPTFDSLEASLSLVEDLAKMPVTPEGVLKRSPVEAKALVDGWKSASDELSESRECLAAAMSDLGQLDPRLNLRVDYQRLDNEDYLQELSNELVRRINAVDHYVAWQRVTDQDVDATISKLRERVRSYERHKGTILADYHPELLEIDYVAMETRFKTEYQSFFKRMFGQHNEDIRTLTGLRRSSSQVDDEEAQRILALVHDLSNEERSLEEASGGFRLMLGTYFQGIHTDFSQIDRDREAFFKARESLDLLDNQRNLVVRSHSENQRLSKVFGDIFEPTSERWTEKAVRTIEAYQGLLKAHGRRNDGVRLAGATSRLSEVSTAEEAGVIARDLASALTQCRHAFEKAEDKTNGYNVHRANLDQLARSAEEATAGGAASLDRSVSCARAKRACVEKGLSSFLEALERTGRAYEKDYLDRYGQILRHTLYRQWIGSLAFVECPVLREFSAREHERRIDKFNDLDAEQLDIDKARVLTELFPRIPSPAVRTRGKDEISILLRELNKKARIRPIRKLFADIPHAVLALKPCLMMSPLSVSTYLESATFQFDTVIFDEASQVRTEDALGVISRGKQVIIAGDSKQLPPTNFFAATIAEDDDQGDEEYYEQAGSFDSVLDEAALLSTVSLKWHYRSRDESLITFSNEEIYDGNLFTFPSNQNSGRDAGVEYMYVPTGVYEGSRKGNAIEAARVADLVMEHFSTYGTERSLGVIALGESQARVIESELLERRLAHPETERFFDTNATEAFFVKNLENVQGDERDTIILSVGYAKGPTGRLSHNFGPINMEGGERRLNVAVTRARINLKLVTSLDPSEIDETRVSNVGPRVLKNYLAYAKVGPQDNESSFLREYGYVDEDVFAEVVHDVLVDAGFEVEEHVGRSGCKVDLAVRHPQHKDCFCIGIMCDGDSYHAATTARDRDRLRTQVLKGMGWKLYHVWARAWLQDPERQATLLVDSVRSAIESFVPPAERLAVETPEEAPSVGQPSVEVDAPELKEVEPKPEPAPLETEYLEVEHHVEEHRYGFQNFPEYKPPRRGTITELEQLEQLVYAQAPFSLDYFLQTYRELFYPNNLKITAAIRKSGLGYLQTKMRNTVIVRKEHDTEYVFRRDQRAVIPRVAGNRSISDISYTELREGVLLVLKGYMGELDRKGLIEETTLAFEFARRGRIINQRIGEAIDDLRSYGKVKVIDGLYVPI